MSGRLFVKPSRELRVGLIVRDVGDGFEAELEDFPLLRETGRTAWEAVNRLVGAHRALLERRWRLRRLAFQIGQNTDDERQFPPLFSARRGD